MLRCCNTFMSTCLGVLVLFLSAPAALSQSEWEGPWAGAGIGWKWLETDIDVTPEDWNVPPPSGFFGNQLTPGAGVPKGGELSPDGFTGGVLVGYNKQFGSIVVGIEADADLTDVEETEIRSSTSIADYDGVNTADLDFAERSETCRNTKDMRGEGSLKARLGYLVSSELMVFATGGVAVANVEHRVDCQSETVFIGANGAGEIARHSSIARGSEDEWEFGWILGLGSELRMNSSWRLRFDYNYVDLQSSTQTVSVNRTTTDEIQLPNTGPSTARYKWDEDYQKIRVGLVYRFGSPALPPPPLK